MEESFILDSIVGYWKEDLEDILELFSGRRGC
jgi:hypothetical protein